MKVVCVLGSPRKNGNSATIARKFLDKAKLNVADIQKYYLNDLEFKGCQACMACKTIREDYILDDGHSAVLNDVLNRPDVLDMAEMIADKIWRKYSHY